MTEGLEQLYYILQSKVTETLRNEGLSHVALLAIDRMLSIAKFLREGQKEEEKSEQDKISFSDED
jgi:hypothetical protein